MNPQRVRETVMRAVLPLIAEWDTVTTAQIARVAGIDEATLLVTFADKDAALTAALHELMMSAFDPTQVVQDLKAIPLDQPLATRLIEAIAALDADHRRMVTVLAPIDAPAALRHYVSPGDDTAGETHTDQAGQDDFRAATRLDVICDAVAELLEPDQEHLRLSPRTLAGAFLGLHSSRKRAPHPGPSQLSAEQLVDLFLHGAGAATRR